MKLLFIIIISLNSYSKYKPFIDGGKKLTPKMKKKYRHFISLGKLGEDKAFCSATKVGHNKFITAAHCIISTDLSYNIKIGMQLKEIGKIIKREVNPKYKSALLKRMDLEKKFLELCETDELLDQNYDQCVEIEKDYNKTGYDITLFDNGILTTDSLPSNKEAPYPLIISKQSKLKNRSKIEIIGFGYTKLMWDGLQDKFNYLGQEKYGHFGENSWKTCPLKYDGLSPKEINELSTNMSAILSTSSKTIHSIENNNETHQHDSNGIFPGDSGAATIEYDNKGNQVITSISVGNKNSVGNNKSYLTIVDKNNIKTKIELKKFPANWGDKEKNDLDFPIIHTHLKRLGLLVEKIDKNGKKVISMKAGTKVIREYSRHSASYFSDLLHPDNQAFIKQEMK